jgi:hypothetical protein
MKYVIILLAIAFSPITQAEDDPPKRGDVVRIVQLQKWHKPTGKTTVLVWDGKANVPVTIPTHYMKKVIVGKTFPYTITHDTRTGRYVSSGRRGL